MGRARSTLARLGGSILRFMMCGRIVPALSRASLILWRLLYREGRRARIPP